MIRFNCTDDEYVFMKKISYGKSSRNTRKHYEEYPRRFDASLDWTVGLAEDRRGGETLAHELVSQERARQQESFRKFIEGIPQDDKAISEIKEKVIKLMEVKASELRKRRSDEIDRRYEPAMRKLSQLEEENKRLKEELESRKKGFLGRLFG